MSDNPLRVKVFLSYSHSDAEWADRLLAHLHEAESKGLVEFWSDREIEAGQNVKVEIERAIESSKIFVLLISPDYLASPFSADYEFPLIAQASKEKAKVIPVLVKPIATSVAPVLEPYNFANAKPLTSLSAGEQEKELIEIASKINAVILKQRKLNASTAILTGVIGGAAVGSSIGSIIPGVGTVIGGLIGGLIASKLAHSFKEDQDDH